MYRRSVDWSLELPFNIVSYGLLTYITKLQIGNWIFELY